MNHYQGLILQIEAFIKRFYINRLVKGGLFFVAIFLLTLLLFSSVEYFLRLGIFIRGALLFSFIGLCLFLVWRYIAEPLLKLFAFGKRMTPTEAAHLIGKLMPSISDKVLNTLQLHDETAGNYELIRAAIEQKAGQLRAVSFAESIRIKDNKKYLKFFLPVLLVFLMVLLINPSIIGSGSKRILNYTHVFVEPAPFQFIWENPLHYAEEGKDVLVKLKIKGKDFPEKTFLVSNYGRFLLKQTSRNTFEYSISNIQSDLDFYFEGAEFQSDKHTVRVFGSSKTNQLTATLHYPNYTGMKLELLDNPVVITVPEGTKITFSGSTENTSLCKWAFLDTSYLLKQANFELNYKAFHSQMTSFSLQNKYSKQWRKETKQIQVIKDQYPSIEAEEKQDTSNLLIHYFFGNVADDYGVKGVYFMSQIVRNGVPLAKEKVRVDGVGKTGGSFYHYLDISQSHLQAGDVLNYYFVVFDNDGVHGSKSSTSQQFTYKVPGKEELEQNRENALSNAQSSFSDLQKELEMFHKKAEELRKSNINNANPWKMKNLLDQLKEEQMNLENKLQEMDQNLEKTMEEKALFDKVNPELLEKQELLKKMLDEVMDEELKKLLEQLSKLLEKNDKEQLEKQMEKMKQSAEEMNREMDRTMEMLKKMAVEEKLDNAIQKLDALKNDQDALKNALEKGLNEQKGEKQQDSLNKRFDALQKDLNELQEKNQTLQRPMELNLENEKQNRIDSEMQQASDKLGDNKGKQAQQNQQNASEQMEQMQQSLEEQKKESEQQQNAEDMALIRSILENLMELSFDEETMMNKVSTISPQNPMTNQQARKQKMLMDDYATVKDSLIALSKRQPQTSKFIDDKIAQIDLNYGSLMKQWGEKNFNQVGIQLQLVMTAYNDLALMLNESLDQMQAQMRQKSGGSGSCSKPGGSKPKPSPGDGMQGMKDALKKQLEQMQQKGKGGEGPNQGEGKGEGMGLPGGLSNKEIAKMAAEQNAIRQALEELKQSLNKDGKGMGNQLNPLLKELEEQQKDLVNKQTGELIKRQKEILTRLLESEKALQEREEDTKRQSKTGENTQNGNLIPFLEYKRKKEAEMELLRTKTPSLNFYYRQQADAYFNNLRKE